MTKRIPIYKYKAWVPFTWIILAIGIYQMAHLIIALRFKDPELWREVLLTTGMTEFNFYLAIGMLSASLVMGVIGVFVYFMRDYVAKDD